MKIMYLTRGDGLDNRAAKMCNSLVKLGHEVVYVGWDRSPEKPKQLNLDPAIKLRILARPGVYGKSSLQGWSDYRRHVVRSLREERPDAVQAINEEKAALVLPFKHLYYRRLIIDVFDSVIANRPPSWWLAAAGHSCRWLANWGADCIIETAEELQAMLGPFIRKSVIIENAPYDPGPELAAQVPVSGPVRVSMGGMLTKRRMGLDVVVAALDLLPAGSVVIEASGWLGDEYAKEVFARHPAVHYQWFDKPAESLKSFAACDALLYLRTDAGESAYRAAVRPNRLFEALAVGRPLIVNPGLAIGRWLERDRLGLILDQLDAPCLARVLQSLPARRAGLPLEAARTRKIFLAGHIWPVMEERLAELYRRYDRPASRA